MVLAATYTTIEIKNVYKCRSNFTGIGDKDAINGWVNICRLYSNPESCAGGRRRRISVTLHTSLFNMFLC
jgi:hypothetical protein